MKCVTCIRTGGHLFLLVLWLYVSLLPASAAAEGMSGFIEFNYSSIDSKADDGAGGTADSRSGTFDQLYNISLKRTIFPNLILNAGAIFESSGTRSSINGQETEFSVTRVRPLIDLRLRTDILTAWAGYSRREERQSGSELNTTTNVSDNYNAVIGWKPEGLPSMDLRFERVDTYDKEKLMQDTVTNFLSLLLRYSPQSGFVKGFDVQYQPSYRETNNRNDAITAEEMTHNARASYSGLYFKRRVSFFTSYNFSHNITEVNTTGTTGALITQIFPFAGLSSLDDTPALSPLDPNSALIDGNRTSGAGINTGVPPPSGDTALRNIGMDFITAQEVNTVSVWIDRELPQKISDAFSWEIYTSSDNSNWALLTSSPPVIFGTFQNRFEITFPAVKTRYLKVVTGPLSLADTVGVQGNFSDIFVTEIQAFLKEQSALVGKHRQDSSTTQSYNIDIRTRLLDIPSMFYEVSYFQTQAASSFRSSTLSNGISADHRFSARISGRARVAREDISGPDEKGAGYIYDASITFVPLKTLSHTLSYSGRAEDIDDQKSNTNSFFMKNNAELYKGINMNIDGGTSVQSKDSGEKTTSTIINAGTGITPHRSITFSIDYSDTESDQSGGMDGDASTFSRRTTASVAYKPFETVYVFISAETIASPDLARDLQNYGFNWSPFPDGSLQVSVAYNESLTSDDGKISTFVPGMRWNINRRTFLDLSTQYIRSESGSQASELVISSAALRTVF